MTNLKTDPGLLSALEKASSRKLTVDEVWRQRVSFIMGSLKETSGVTRDKVQEILARQEGEKDRK